MLSCQTGLGPMRKSLNGKLLKKQKSWYILLYQFSHSHCLVLTLRKVFELWKYCSCKISMCQWRNNKKTFKTQPVEKITSCRKHFHKETFGSLLGHYLVNSIKRSHSNKKNTAWKGHTEQQDTLQLLNSSGWEKNPNSASEQGVLYSLKVCLINS